MAAAGIRPTRPVGRDGGSQRVRVLRADPLDRHLKRRDIYAPKSSRWRDPRAQLLSGEAWESANGPALRALGLPEDPTELLDRHARDLDTAYREVARRIQDGTEVTVDEEGKLHVSALEAIPDPPSLIELRKRVQAMLPRVGLPEVILLGKREYASTLAPLQPNCVFSGQVSLRRRRLRPVRLRLLIHFNGNGYLAPRSARAEQVVLP